MQERTDDEIKSSIIRKNGWVWISEEDFEKRNNSPNPNIYFYITQDNEIEMGLVFSGSGKVLNILTLLLEKYNDKVREQLLYSLSKLNNEYKTKLNRETKLYHHLQSPEPTKVCNYNTNEINDEKLRKILSEVEKIKKEGKIKRAKSEVNQEYPSLNLIYRTLKKEDVENTIRDIFPIYKIVSGIKDKKSYEKEMDLKKKEELDKFIFELNKKNLDPKVWRKEVDDWLENWRREY